MFGIREFKGLEETHICLYGFFGGIEDEEVAAGWRQVLATDREDRPNAAAAEMSLRMENELKLLYTAVTRCRVKLIFIEPDVNPAELPQTLQSFKQWMSWHSLVTKFERQVK